MKRQRWSLIQKTRLNKKEGVSFIACSCSSVRSSVFVFVCYACTWVVHSFVCVCMLMPLPGSSTPPSSFAVPVPMPGLSTALSATPVPVCESSTSPSTSVFLVPLLRLFASPSMSAILGPMPGLFSYSSMSVSALPVSGSFAPPSATPISVPGRPLFYFRLLCLGLSCTPRFFLYGLPRKH